MPAKCRVTPGVTGWGSPTLMDQEHVLQNFLILTKFPVLWEGCCRFFPSTFLPLHCRFLFVWRVRRTFFPSRWVFFYLVTTGWIFHTCLLCRNSINQIQKIPADNSRVVQLFSQSNEKRDINIFPRILKRLAASLAKESLVVFLFVYKNGRSPSTIVSVFPRQSNS